MGWIHYAANGMDPQRCQLTIAKKIKLLEVEAEETKLLLEKNKQKQFKIENTFRDEVTEKWLALTGNLNQMGNELRGKLRQLVKDTFKSITLDTDDEGAVIGLDKAVELQLMGERQSNFFDLTLEFHNGKKRLIRLDKHSGELLLGLDL